MPKKPRNLDIVPGVSTEQLLQIEGAPWAKACAIEMTKLWNKIFPKLNQELTLQGFSPMERAAILDDAKATLFQAREEVLANWTRPYVEALVDVPPTEASEAHR